MRKASVVIWAFFVVVWAASAMAGEVSGSGTSIIMAAAPAETELSDGRMYTQMHSEQVLVADGHPFDGVAMSCHGVCLMEGESGTCAGGCGGVDKDGDLIHFSFDGVTAGDWKLLGGSGKWANASGSGTWKEGGTLGATFTSNDWTGTIQMK